MTNNKHTASLDEVLADYERASQEFDARVLHAFIEKYPDHARALQRYAQIQLTSVPATVEEIDNEPLSDEEMLPKQSSLLQRMQQLIKTPSASEASEAAAKLASIVGEQALQAAAVAVFGSCGHGEDVLLLSVTESASESLDVPGWFYEDLSVHVGAPPAALIAGMTLNRQRSRGQQRFSTKEKPKEPVPISWEQMVDDCISDDAAKKTILERSKRS
jgi:hypothetical protein